MQLWDDDTYNASDHALAAYHGRFVAETGEPSWVFAALTSCDSSCDADAYQSAMRTFASEGSVANIR